MEPNDKDNPPPSPAHEQEATRCLRQYIDFSKVQCLNEYEPHTGKAILKPYDSRLSNTPRLLSPDDDPELLLRIPFTEAVTLQQLCLRAGSEHNTAAPWHVRLFVDRDNLDFDDVRELKPVQELQVDRPDENGLVLCDCLPHGKFKDISCLTLHVVDNHGQTNVATELTYLGLLGEVSHLQRKAVQTVHEGQGLPSEYKAFDETFPGPCVSDSQFG